VRELPPDLYEEWQEGYVGGLRKREPLVPIRPELLPHPADLADLAAGRNPAACGYCRHKIFGRGKIVEHIPPDKCRVNFPGLGLKVILSNFLTPEE
jgi:DNA helicase-2/ATP-dependent DNA helicase PcrA